MISAGVSMPNVASWRRLLLGASLAAGTVLLYAQVAGHPFIWFDDPRYVTENAMVRRGLSWDGVHWAFTTLHASNWHPLTWLSHMLDVQLFGVNPGPHHLVNVALHAANTWVLFAVLTRMTGAPLRSAFVAALFGVHPLHVESVAWVAERKDVLSTLFGFVMLWCYSRYAERPSIGRYGIVFMCFVLSLLAKPMWVTAPALLLLIDLWPMRRVASEGARGDAPPSRFAPRSAHAVLLEKLPLIALSFASAAATVLAQGRGGTLSGLDIGILTRLANATISYARYAWKTIWPEPLTIFYPFPVNGMAVWETVAAATFVVGASVAAIAMARRAPWLAAGWFWFVGMLVPVIGFVQVGSQAMADRYSYVPIVGLFIVLVWGAHAALGSWRRGIPLFGSAVAVVLALSLGTIRQVGFWRDNEVLFGRSLELRESALMHGVLSQGLRQQGNLSLALFHGYEAVRLEPASARHMGNVAVIHRDLQQFELARDRLHAAVELDPRYVTAWSNLGLVEQDVNNPGAAAAALARAIALSPQDAQLRFRLGVLQSASGKLEEAVNLYHETLQLQPDHGPAWNEIAIAYQRLGRIAEAGEAFETVARLEPGNPMAWRNLGVYYSRIGRLAEGSQALTESLRLQPGELDVVHRLGVIAASLGQRDRARALAAQLDAVAPSLANDIRVRAEGTP